MYASHVRRLFAFTAFSLALGCRAPAIPNRPSTHEYAVYSAWIEQASSTSPPQLSFAVDSETLTPNQNELQFQQCLPRRMSDVFEDAPSASLTSTSSNDWLSLDNGRPAHLHPHNSSIPFDRPTELFRLSRVAFTRFGFDAYLWVDHRTCRAGDTEPACDGLAGALIHGRKANGAWTFEDTTCHILVFPVRLGP